MELRQLRYFVAVAEELHFGRAARRLHISQPPLSQQILSLEREMGVQLFTRGGRSVQLTPAGTRFLEHARVVLRQTAQAVSSAQRAARGEIGELSIGFVSSLALTLVPRVLSEFVRRYPAITLLLHEQSIAEQLDALQEGRLQIGLLRPPVTLNGLEIEWETLLVEPLIVAIPQAHPLAALDRVPVEALRDQPLIAVPRGYGLSYPIEISRMFHRAGFEPKVVQEIRHLHAAIGLVGAGIGLTILPESLSVVQLAGVVYRPIAGSQEGAEIALAWRPGDTSPAMLHFRELAKAVLARQPDGLPSRLSLSPALPSPAT